MNRNDLNNTFIRFSNWKKPSMVYIKIFSALQVIQIIWCKRSIFHQWQWHYWQFQLKITRMVTNNSAKYCPETLISSPGTSYGKYWSAFYRGGSIKIAVLKYLSPPQKKNIIIKSTTKIIHRQFFPTQTLMFKAADILWFTVLCQHVKYLMFAAYKL